MTRTEWQDVTDQVKRVIPMRQGFAIVGWRTRYGKRAFCGLCECSRRDPSISFSDRKGVWRCHHCDRGGSVIDLIMCAHGSDFITALKFLAAEAGIQLPEATSAAELRRLRREQKKRRQEREELDADCDSNEQEERELRQECWRQLRLCDDAISMPGEWTEQVWRLAAMAEELRYEYLLPEYTLLSFGAMKQRIRYVLAGELERMAMVRAVRLTGGAVADDEHFVEVLTT
jgi:hypothetical protein